MNLTIKCDTSNVVTRNWKNVSPEFLQSYKAESNRRKKSRNKNNLSAFNLKIFCVCAGVILCFTTKIVPVKVHGKVLKCYLKKNQ